MKEILSNQGTCIDMREDPNSRIIVFDGYCHLCSGWARFIGRHPTYPPFKVIPMQSAEGQTLLVGHGIDPKDPTTFLVLDRGRPFTASDATLHVTAASGGVWRLVNVARIVPRRWRDAIYGVVARNRYRWFGRRCTCYLAP
jgi:predicted DCC family thiol-disulfide oxidoreductase YuxK